MHGIKRKVLNIKKIGGMSYVEAKGMAKEHRA